MLLFLSTPSARRATDVDVLVRVGVVISIHALREEGDGFLELPHLLRIQFLSTPSARRATRCPGCPCQNHHHFYPRPPRGGRPPSGCAFRSGYYFYPRPPRGGRQVRREELNMSQEISIHALREEGDFRLSGFTKDEFLFLSTPSARRATRPAADTPYGAVFLSTPSARRATLVLCDRKDGRIFLSTPSARRATNNLGGAKLLSENFYPRPPRGGRRCQLSTLDQIPEISIHALREEGDPAARVRVAGVHRISIHALREEGDPAPPGSTPSQTDFYPRPPRGGRRLTAASGNSRRRNFYPRPPRGGRLAFPPFCRSGETFLSTPSARRATSVWRLGRPRSGISIHALREEGDGVHRLHSRGTQQFLSTPSARRATASGDRLHPR